MPPKPSPNALPQGEGKIYLNCHLVSLGANSSEFNLQVAMAKRQAESLNSDLSAASDAGLDFSAELIATRNVVCAPTNQTNLATNQTIR